MTTLEEIESPPKSTRRHFLRNLVGATGAVVAAAALEKASAAPLAGPSPAPLAGPSPATSQAALIPLADLAEAKSTDVLERMRAELVRALARPAAERRWVMVIDLRQCIGCHACTISCVAENKLPPGVVYRPVLEEELGTYPNVTRRFLPKPCMQCANPPCVSVCPVSATYTNEDGVVVVDYEQCIGCRYCITACPYNARTFDFGFMYSENAPEAAGLITGAVAGSQYERASNFEYGKAYRRNGADSSPVGNVRKCHFCLHRLEAGMLPACTTTCIGRATYFGDANDPESLVAELISRPNIMLLKEELGTKPRVYYLT